MTNSYVRIHDGGDRSVICFPWSGTGAAPFRNWKPVLPAGVSLLAARTGGREDRRTQPPPTDWDGMVADLVDDLTVDQPFVFFGHCLGALVAFEVTRELRRRGRAMPARLLVVGPPPGHPGRLPPFQQAIVEMRKSGAIAARILDSPEVFSLFEPAIRADVQLARSYRHVVEPPLATPIDVFIASAERESAEADSAQRWQEETTRDLRVTIIEGRSLLPHGAWGQLAEAVFAAASGND